MLTERQPRKVVLFLPPYDGRTFGPPLGLLSLAASLRSAGFEPKVIDGIVERRVVDGQIETRGGEWQMIEFRFDDGELPRIVFCRKQPVAPVIENIERAWAMTPQ